MVQLTKSGQTISTKYSISNKDTIFVAQSVSTQFVVKYINERDLNIHTYISCAGPYDILQLRPNIDERPSSFYNALKTFKLSPNDFTKFKDKSFNKYSLFCDNDTFFEQNNLEKYAKSIGAKPFLIHNKGHFQVDILNELEDLIKDIA